MKNISRTINYYTIDKVPDSRTADIDVCLIEAFNNAPTVGKRLRRGKGDRRACLANVIEPLYSEQKNLGTKVVLVTYEEGFRPKKIERRLQNESLNPEDLNLGPDEEIVDIIHLFIRQNHAILESRKTASPKFVADYLSWLLQKEYNENYPNTFLNPLANRKVIDEIREQGVQEIRLNVSSFHGPLNAEAEDIFSTLTQKVNNLEANKAEVTFKSSKKGKALALEESERIYFESKKHPGEQYVSFLLTNGNLVSDKEFRLRESIKVQNDGTNNALSNDIFEKIVKAYFKWVKDGYIQDRQLAGNT
ncbi:hypothetical protein DENIS_0159 [Desulfonema ishimotonii]|uniref:Uncharacterized protein n=1 Tax=Desulfonema ishimotonii TaxID=45657 RepID=A0A401FQG3_9BACT|nr:hypothetical protein [Desulfonema ishimotonii]GBC59223.1 hypothetical protein DENIS_0159 [Desulfonema ishimotonii]